MNPLIIAVVAFLAYRMYKQTEEISNNLNYSFSGIKYKKDQSGILATSIQANMILKNPTNVSAKISSIQGTAVFNGKYSLGSYFVNSPFTIPANGSVSVPIVVSISNVEGAKALLSFFSTKVGGAPELTLEGTISSTLGSIPFTYTYKGW